MAGRVTRRRLLVLGGMAAATATAVACNQQSIDIPTPATGAKPATGAAPASSPAAGASGVASAATSAPASAAGAAATPATGAAPAAGAASPAAGGAAAAVPDVARKDTLILSVSDSLNQMQDSALMNPFLNGAQRTGWHFAFEPLYYYNPYWTDDISAPPGLKGKNGEIPYQAESYEYNQDNTQLTIKLRKGITWSDGQPFTAKDVAFTLNMLRDNAPKLNFSTDMKVWVKNVETPDDQTVKISFNSPAPQFMFTYFQWHMDAGFPIVPEHIFKGQDPLTFTNFDMAKSWPVVTGPWKLSLSVPEQKIWDRRDDWWGAKQSFHDLPKMKRVIVVPHYDDPKKAQLLIGGQVDATHNLQPVDVEVALAKNKNLRVYTADSKPPYGCLDWWVPGISFNNSKAPYNDPEIRWAINYALDRKQLMDVGYRNTTEAAVVPLPAYPAMKPWVDAIQDLIKKRPIDEYNPNKTAEILQSKGWKKDPEGFWAKDGKRFEMIIHIPGGFFQNAAPVVVAQFRKAGFDASFKSPANEGTLVSQGDADVYMAGHSGGIRDPFLTLNLYHSRYSAPQGEPAVQPYRWKNADYDKIVDDLAKYQPSDPKFMQLYRQAMEIWLRELPEISMNQWYLIMPVLTQFWKGWPDDKNPYTSSAGWHRGAAGLFINTLQPA